MRTYRNVKKIKGKEQLGRRLSTIGLVVLFIGLFASFSPNYFTGARAESGLGQFMSQWWPYISFAALPLGFIFASVGSYFINRFARRRWPGSKKIARPDEMLERNMKGFDDKYAYFAYSLPPAYVLVGPCGIQILTVRSDKGRVVVSGDKWREPFSFGRIFTIFAREGVGNPRNDLLDQGKKLSELIAEAPDPDQFESVPVEGAAVFLNPEVQLDVDNPTVPALRGDQLKAYIRRRAKENKVNAKTLKALTEYLVSVSEYQEDEEE